MILAQIIKSIFEIALVGAFIFSSIYFIITFISLSKKRLTKSAFFLKILKKHYLLLQSKFQPLMSWPLLIAHKNV